MNLTGRSFTNYQNILHRGKSEFYENETHSTKYICLCLRPCVSFVLEDGVLAKEHIHLEENGTVSAKPHLLFMLHY